MALRNLTTQLMVSFSQNWIDATRERPIIERYSISRALLPRLEEVHGNLLSFQRKSLESQEAIAGIQRTQARLDAEHDRNVRGVYNYLTALAELSGEEERAEYYLELRDLLLPDGLQAVIRSYAAQGGEVLLLQQRLNRDVQAALRDIPTPDGNLYDHVEAWMKAGLALRALEEKRVDVAKTVGKAELKGTDVIRARNEWIRTVHALRANLDLDGASAEDVERIFRYLDAAEAKADRAAALPARSSDANDDPTTGPLLDDDSPLGSDPGSVPSSPCIDGEEDDPSGA